MKIIVRLPNWLGDCVMATPILSDLREKYPTAQIDVLAKTSCAELIIENPHVNKIIPLNKKNHCSIVKRLRCEKYDMGVLLTNSFSSAWLLWKAGVKEIIGFKGQWRTWLLDKAIQMPIEREKIHQVFQYKTLLTHLGISTESCPQLFLSQSEKTNALQLLRNSGIPIDAEIIGINPGAAYGSAKCWLPERFTEVTRNLLQDQHRWVIFFGDKTGRPLVNDICTHLNDRCINLAGQTSIRQMLAIIHCCHKFLTNDSGPMHIAAALNIPLVALFGSTNEIATGPFNWGQVIHKHVECSPCYKRTCPIDFRCMKRISSQEVIQKIKQV